jgi:hypothetical protein
MLPFQVPNTLPILGTGHPHDLGLSRRRQDSRFCAESYPLLRPAFADMAFLTHHRIMTCAYVHLLTAPAAAMRFRLRDRSHMDVYAWGPTVQFNSFGGEEARATVFSPGFSIFQTRRGFGRDILYGQAIEMQQ